MSFFGGLKRALGWSGDDDDNEDYISYEDTSSNANSYSAQGQVKVNETQVGKVVEFKDSDEIPEGVFDGLIDIVNANLSPMVLKCLDVEAEKKYLYEALGPGFSSFVKDTREKSLGVARSEWEKEKSELNLKIEDYKSRCEAAENEMCEMKAMKMSEDRQKVALKERLRSLEDQVAKAEAEKEQYDLENKSLLNKLKVSQVRSEANEEAEKEIVELKAEIARLKAQSAEGVPEETLKALEEEYNAKMEINNALINELRSEAAKNKEQLTETEKTIAELNEKLAENESKLTEAERRVTAVETERDNAQSELAKASADLEKVSAELESAKSDMNDMSESLSVLDDIQEQLEKVEEFKKKKAEEIQGLQEKILVLEQEKAKAVEAVRDEDILKGRIAELELELSACNDKMSALAQENTDTLEMLRKREEALESHKAELQKVRGDYDILKQEYEAESNALKTAAAEKTKKFQAEIAELQAKLNVNGKIDDYLVDDDLRQAVEETFDVSLDESDFEGFVEPVADTPLPGVPEIQTIVESVEITPVEQEESTPEAELDDIDWLLPDTAEAVIKEEEKKKEKEAKEQEEYSHLLAKDAEETETQMSLFG